jgi:uncharacterized SAM-binding protein YcdF (DUF218 family)
MKQMKNFHHKRYQFLYLTITACLLVLLSIIPIRLALTQQQVPFPQAILTLGGGQEREQFAALFAQNHPSLEVWVSSGMRPDRSRALFQVAGISEERVHLDCRAVDTVTNFTSLVADFKQKNVRHLYLITADFHMTRAQAIATFVLGSQGIMFTPIPIPDLAPNRQHAPESWPRTLRDSGRAILWILTGRTGASLNPEPVTPCT